MAKVRRYLNRVNGWDQTATAIEANAVDLPHLEMPRAQLAGFSAEVKSLIVQQGALTASKQEATRRVQQLMRDGDALVDFLRTGVRQRYGKESEKLAEFGLQPFRGLNTSGKRKANPDPEPPTAPIPTPTPDTVK